MALRIASSREQGVVSVPGGAASGRFVDPIDAS
jgi:hypothetical protein